MDKETITIVFFVIAVVLYFLFLMQERRKVFMYRFFKLRDRLYHLAIEGKIDENSISFKTLTMMLNITIAYSKEFTLSRFIKALEVKKLDEPNKNEAFINDLVNQDAEIKKLAVEFFYDFVALMVRNNLVLTLLINVRIQFKSFIIWTPKIFNFYTKRFETAMSYKESARTVNDLVFTN